jgi:hypothetical protein
MNRPVGIYIVAIVAILRGLWEILKGLAGLGFSTFALFGGNFDAMAWTLLFGVGGLLVGTILLVLGVGLWTFRPWALMWTVVILLVGIGLDVLRIFTGGGNTDWIGLLVSVVIVIYLLTPGVRNAFAAEE